MGSTRHRLVLFYGAGSGKGKSTLSRLLFDRLAENQVPSRLIREEDVLKLDAFAAYVRAVSEGRGGDAAELLASCTAFVRGCEETDEVWICDSILPGSDWLASSGCPPERIRRFSRDLARMLTELDPLLVLLVGNVERALARAIEERGLAWARGLAAKRCADDEPDALVPYFSELEALSLELLAEWPFEKLVLDTSALDLRQCEREILSRVESGRR